MSYPFQVGTFRFGPIANNRNVLEAPSSTRIVSLNNLMIRYLMPLELVLCLMSQRILTMCTLFLVRVLFGFCFSLFSFSFFLINEVSYISNHTQTLSFRYYDLHQWQGLFCLLFFPSNRALVQLTSFQHLQHWQSYFSFF